MTDTRKYHIKEYFDQFPKEQRKVRIEEACNLLGISYDHLRKIWNYKLNDPNEAKPSQLDKLAIFFGCKIEDLITKVNEVETIS